MPLVLDGTNGVSGVDGTASNPAIEGTDSNTGIFYPAADTVAIGTGGTEALRVNSSQNVGIGTQSPAYKLHVSNYMALGTQATSGAGAGISMIPSSTLTNWFVGSNYVTSGAFEIIPSTAGGGSTFTTPAFMLNSSGNVGIGTSSPGSILAVSAASPTITLTATTTTGTTIGNKNNRLALLSDSSTVGNGGEIVFGATDTNVDRWGAISGAIQTNSASGATGDILFATKASDAATSLTERARITSGGSLLVGVTSGLGKVVIANADGANAPTTVTAANSYLHIGSGDFGPAGNGKFMVAFGYTGTSYTNAPAYIGFEETTGVGGTKGYLSFYTRDVTTDTAPTERARITSAGGFTCAGIYNTTVGATNRDVFVDNGGVVGYVSSLRASKTNIQDLTDTSWLHQLNPVTFNYRKKDEEGSYTDETDGDIQYGLIAEDVEQVRPDLCFYDEVDGEQELRGIQYSKLVPVMLKEIQKLKAEIEALKGNA